MIGDGQMLQFAHDRAPYARARAAEHFVGNARVDDVRGDILQQHDDQHDGIDGDQAHDLVRHAARGKVDDVGRDDWHDPDGQIFEYEHKEARQKAPYIVFEKPLVKAQARTVFPLAAFGSGALFVEQILKIGDHVIASLIFLLYFRKFRHDSDSPTLSRNKKGFVTVQSLSSQIRYHKISHLSILKRKFSKKFFYFFAASSLRKTRHCFAKKGAAALFSEIEQHGGDQTDRNADDLHAPQPFPEHQGGYQIGRYDTDAADESEHKPRGQPFERQHGA